MTPAGAKLIDVFGAESQVREAAPRAARPECEQVRGPSAADGAAYELAAMLEAVESYDDEPLYAPWWGNNFGWRRHPGDVGGGSRRGDVGYGRGR